MINNPLPAATNLNIGVEPSYGSTCEFVQLEPLSVDRYIIPVSDTIIQVCPIAATPVNVSDPTEPLMSLHVAPSLEEFTTPLDDTEINLFAFASISFQVAVDTPLQAVKFTPSVVLEPLPFPNKTVMLEEPILPCVPT